MTEKDDLTTNDSSETLDETHINTDDLDVEGALAALSSLQDLTRDDADDEQDTETDEAPTASEIDEIEETDDLTSDEIEPFERIEEDDFADEGEISDSVDISEQLVEDAPQQAETERLESYETAFPHPPISVLHRGQLASVVPALLLIGVGSYLTFIVTTSEATLQLPLIATIAVSGLGAMLLAQWLSTSRWSIGSFFIGVLLLLTGGTVAYLVLPNQLSFADGYPLILTAIGTAFVITDVFMPSGRRIWLIGLILAIAGLAGVFATTTIMTLDIAEALSGLLPVAVIVIIVLLVAPLVRQRQQ
ncbi:MAG: hypothetical protein AAF846_08245 [Chloroflexota bacterium]